MRGVERHGADDRSGQGELPACSAPIGADEKANPCQEQRSVTPPGGW